MIERYYFEFSKIYCRLMRLEMKIKTMLISSLLPYYKEEIISVFEKFFINKERLKRYSRKTGNAFVAILRNPQIKSNSQKFVKLINIMFLSDVLFLFLCCEQFRKNEIIDKFYFKIPEKYGKLIKSRETLLDLRNTIAHYNFKDYEQNKRNYLEILNLFEMHMGANIKGVEEIPRFQHNKPTIKDILIAIEKLRPDLLDINNDLETEYFYNKHRILLDLFDDVALHNGYIACELPSPWAIFRQMQEIKRNS